jgi:hypothetical protein
LPDGCIDPRAEYPVFSVGRKSDSVGYTQPVMSDQLCVSHETGDVEATLETQDDGLVHIHPPHPRSQRAL